MGVSQPRVAKLEFAIDVAPVDHTPSFVTARARKVGAVEHDDVALVIASSH